MTRKIVCHCLLGAGICISAFASLHAVSYLNFESIFVPGASIAPAQADVVLLEIKAVNSGAESGKIKNVTLSYSGSTQSDIMPSSVRLYEDTDGDRNTNDRVQLGSSQSFNPDCAIGFENRDAKDGYFC